MVINYLGFEIVKPTRDEIVIEDVQFNYDRLSDTLMVHFFGEPRPAFSLDVNEYAYLRVEMETNKIVGVQVEAFLTKAIYHDPRYLLWALRAGITWEELATVHQHMMPESLQQAAVDSVIQDIELAIA